MKPPGEDFINGLPLVGVGELEANMFYVINTPSLEGVPYPVIQAYGTSELRVVGRGNDDVYGYDVYTQDFRRFTVDTDAFNAIVADAIGTDRTVIHLKRDSMTESSISGKVAVV